jgi:hypothetical protein
LVVLEGAGFCLLGVMDPDKQIKSGLLFSNFRNAQWATPASKENHGNQAAWLLSLPLPTLSAFSIIFSRKVGQAVM